MIAKFVDGNIIPCPKTGDDGSGKYHTNLPRFYENHLDEASIAGYYPVIYTEKPGDNYISSWNLQLYLERMCIIQVWTEYTPTPEPPVPDIYKMQADIDYLLMMGDYDGGDL